MGSNMPLEILAPLVVIGIAGIALLTHLMGFSVSYTFADEDDARARWLREHTGDEITKVILSHDRHAALIETRHGAGIVWAMGADTVAKRMTRARVEELSHGLCLRFDDFTTPTVSLRLDADEAVIWKAKVKEIAA